MLGEINFESLLICYRTLYFGVKVHYLYTCEANIKQI